VERTHRWTIALGALALGCTVGAARAQTPEILNAMPAAPLVSDQPMPDSAPNAVPALAPAPGARLPTPPAAIISAGPAVPEPGPGMVPPGSWVGETGGASWGHVTGGAGTYFLKPYGQGGEAFTTLTTTTVPAAVGAASTTTSSTITPFTHGAEFSPLVWLGYVTPDGLGARVRWWRFSEASSQQTGFGPSVTPASVPGVPFTTTTIGAAEPFGLEFIELDSTDLPGVLVGPGTVTAAEELRLNVWDFEATEDFSCGNWRGLVAFGARYAAMANTYLATGSLVMVSPTGATTTLTETLGSHTDFNGIGPTLAVELRRCLGGPRLSIFASARGALLFGTTRQGGFDVNELARVNPAGVLVSDRTGQDTTFHDHQQAISVGEVELGAEWSRCFGSFTPFVRAAVVGQTWMEVGTATDVDGDLDFIGLSLTAGVNF
jgi:hypothetical protein